MARKIGRPMKYPQFITALDDTTFYSPASIVRHGREQEIFAEMLLEDATPEQEKKLVLLIRHTLARFSQNHQFPPEGDGLVYLTGQAPIRGWYGKRWKCALDGTVFKGIDA